LGSVPFLLADAEKLEMDSLSVEFVVLWVIVAVQVGWDVQAKAL